MRLLPALALTLGLATPVTALDLSAMSEAERTAFGAAVRSYLLENPEVLMEAIGVLEQRQQEDQASRDLRLLAEKADAIFNNPDDWAGGNLAGDITLVEFVDYRCGYCRRAHDEVAQLVSNDGNIRIVMKEFPILGEDSMTSARFAIAARRLGGDSAYKQAHDALITLRGPVDDAALGQIAATIGLELGKLKTEMESEAVAGIIRANHALGADLDINGTPTFVLPSTMIRGFVPLAGMEQIVAGQRAKN